MELEIGKFILLYLLLPFIGIILGAVMFFVGKKNKLLNNKKLIYFVLISCVLLALPGLSGYINYWFMPYVYISLQILYFFLGWYFLVSLKSVEKDIENKPYYVEFLFVFVIMIFAGGIFSMIFNLCNELQYGLWACSCIFPFAFPSLFRKAYHTLIDIPLEIYKIWSYNKQDNNGLENDTTDGDKIIVVELELSINPADPVPLNIKAKASQDMLFGVWFKIFINDYNIKSPSISIAYNDHEDSYGWIFYRISSILGRKKYIDPDLSFNQNKIKEHQVVMAKRAKYEDNNQLTDK